MKSKCKIPLRNGFYLGDSQIKTMLDAINQAYASREQGRLEGIEEVSSTLETVLIRDELTDAQKLKLITTYIQRVKECLK